MADRPILFSAPMICALIDGRKTQTRRVLKPLPNRTIFFDPKKAGQHQHASPRFRVGNRLWVREAWRCNGWATDLATIFYAASEGEGYTAMCEKYSVVDKKPLRVTAGWRPSIHMPRWASRLTLIVTGVRVERLQDISEEDAIAEGVQREKVGGYLGWNGCPDGGVWPTAAKAYCDLWDHINGPDAWEANPWVAAYTFEVERTNIDQLARAA